MRDLNLHRTKPIPGFTFLLHAEQQGYAKGFGCVFMSDALISWIRPGELYLGQSDSKSIKTEWPRTQHLLSAAVNGDAVKALSLVMNVSQPNLCRMGYWPCSKWLQRRLPRFSWLFALSCFVKLHWHMKLWVLGLFSALKKWLLWQGCSF